MNKKKNAHVYCSVLLALFCVSAGAQETRERAGFMLGAFITDRDTRARLDSSGGDPGSDLDLEGELGLEQSTSVARLGGYFWMTPRQRLDFSLFDLSRSASRQIDETIEFGDQVFNIDTVVSSKSDLSIVKAAYTFAVVNRQRSFLGVTGGLYVASTELTLSEPTLGAFESEDLTAPLPVFGLRGEYEINDRLTFRGSAEIFKIDTGDVDGRLSDLQLGLDYRLRERWALGLAYNEVSMSIDATEDGGLNGKLDWGYDGFLLYLKWDLGNQALPTR